MVFLYVIALYFYVNVKLSVISEERYINEVYISGKVEMLGLIRSFRCKEKVLEAVKTQRISFINCILGKYLYLIYSLNSCIYQIDVQLSNWLTQ